MDAPPTDELLEKRPVLRLAILSLALVVLAELVALYIPAAITDFLTVLVGVRMLHRDMHGFVRDLPFFTAVACLNFAVQAFTFMQIFAGPRGGAHFFQDKCMVPVTRMQNDQQVHETLNLCSWQTILGNVGLGTSVVLEFACVRLGWRMYKSMHLATSASMSSHMLSMGEMESAMSRIGPFLRTEPSADGIQIQPEAGMSTAGQTPGRVSGAQDSYTPFAGQPHYLSS